MLGAQARAEIALIGHQQFGGDRRGGRAQVGGEIGQGHVGLVADGRHHRGDCRGDGACQVFVVERPQVLERTAAAGQQDRVVAAAGVCLAQQRGDLRRGAVALDQARQDVHLQQRHAPAEHAQHVAHRGAAGRGDDRQAPHEAGQGALALAGEQAFGGEPGLELLERPAQRAFAGFLQMIQHQLVVAARFVQGQAPARQHPQAFARHEPQPLALGLEHRAAHLRARILQGEIEVAGRGAGDVAQFAFHPGQREGALQQVAGQRVELAGAEDLVGAIGHAGSAGRTDAYPRTSAAASGCVDLAACRASAHCTCSRTSGEGCCARAPSAASTCGVVGALPSATARLRSQRS
ncbi:hypothetical protein NB705_003476 [Xanthomonas sacchari]|nr:hypothetical protein [Xanthomonas sacchari]